MKNTFLQPETATGPELAVGDNIQPLGDKRAVAAMVGGMSVRWVDGEMAKGMPHLKLGPRRCRFDLEEVRAWLKERYGIRRLGRATNTPTEFRKAKSRTAGDDTKPDGDVGDRVDQGGQEATP